jgi:putative endonuclease
MRYEKLPMVYILASTRNGALYIGVTSDLCGRIAAHKQGLLPGFTKRYNIKLLVYVEEFSTMEEAIAREKELKRFHREWKIALIEKANPEWRDLFFDLCGMTE